MGNNKRIISSYKSEAEEEPKLPQCPYCYNPVRKPGYKTQTLLYPVANPPRNSAWDGCCENCGHDFSFKQSTDGINMFEDGSIHRTVQFKPANHAFCYFWDAGIVYAGVEINVSERQVRNEKVNDKIFLTLEELESLVDYLVKNKVVMKQYHWLEDGT